MTRSAQAFAPPKRTPAVAALDRKRARGQDALSWLHRKAQEAADENERSNALYILSLCGEPHRYAIDLDANDDFRLTTPENQSLTIPATVDGLRLIRSLLIARAITPELERKLGMPSKPVQQQVEDFLRNRELEKAIKEHEDFETLKELF